MSQHRCWGFSWNTWKLSPKLHKSGLSLQKKLKIAANTILRSPKKQQIIEKEAKKGFPQNIFANTLLHNYTQIGHTLFTEEGILILWGFYLHRFRCCSLKRLRMLITLWPMSYSVASFDATQKMWWFLASCCWELFHIVWMISQRIFWRMF